jgi:hypothetical protein
LRILAFVTVLAITVLSPVAAPEPDRLAAELERWSAVLGKDTRIDALWLDARKSGEPLLAQAEEELRQGRRLVALERLAALGQTLGAALYATGRPAEQRKDLREFEAEWKRMGVVLRDVVTAERGERDLAATIRPAFVRALAEISVSHARELYAASLEYGRNTEPQYGLYYLGAARAQRNFLDIARGLPAPPAVREPPLRLLRPEIDALQRDLLAAYRPPPAIERHSEFIVASAALKEARELDAAGRRYAALLRYLQAAQRVSALRPHDAVDIATVNRRLEESAARLEGTTDHSVARFFIERARSALVSSSDNTGEAVAAAIATDVLPRYFAAVEPARPVAAVSDPRVTVTLVRWPFT